MEDRAGRLNHRRPPPQPAAVAVVGGGWAGCAAAVTLADGGAVVTLYEQAKTLGGRARRISLDGIALDNGQHLLLGAYRETLRIVERAHGSPDAPARLFRRMPLTLEPFGNAAGLIALRAPRLPAPLHLLAAILTARGIGWRERRALVHDFRDLQRRGFRCDPALTVRAAFEATPRTAFDAFWAPLCLAALNTPPDTASATVFARVLAAAFTGRARGSDFLMPSRDLSVVLPDAAQRHVLARGGRIVTGTRVLRLSLDAERVAVASRATADAFDAVVVAAGPHQLAHLDVVGSAQSAWRALQDCVARWHYEPITTVYLGYDRIACPPIARLDDAPGQWVFDRGPHTLAGKDGRLIAVVISACGPHEHLPHAGLVATIDAQLRRAQPALGPLRWSRVVTERRATYACVPGLVRPAPGQLGARLHLAGDYTDPELPATLEAAVRSGVAAGRSALAELHAASLL